MRKEFSKAWKASKQPRKQRKFRANAPLHIKRKMLAVNLSKDLRNKTGKRNIVVRKNDKVKIMRGKFKGKEGKVLTVFTKIRKVTIEGIQIKKMDGSKVAVKIQPSNIQIIEIVDRKTKVAKKKPAEKKEAESKKETTKKKKSNIKNTEKEK